MKYLRKFNESNDYYEEIPNVFEFDKLLNFYHKFSKREIDYIIDFYKNDNDILLSVNDVKIKIKKTIEGYDDFGDKFKFFTKSIIYKGYDEWYFLERNIERTPEYYKADQIDGLLKLLKDKI